MLINLTNHPAASWSAHQRAIANREYGTIVDLPFPDIPPDLTAVRVEALAAAFVGICLEVFRREVAAQRLAVHVMGEMTFVYQFVKAASDAGIKCVASVSARDVDVEANGRKTATFRFAGFRTYQFPEDCACACA